MPIDQQNNQDDDLRWRLEVLKKTLDEGKIHIASHLMDDLKASLARVRYGLDGKVDLSTVDGQVRTLALLATHLHQRNEAKDAISLRDVAEMYFDFIESNLGFISKEASIQGLDAAQFAIRASKTPQFVASIQPQISGFLEALEEFWTSVSESADYHLQDLQASKAIFGGDLFPSYQNNISSTASLYIDTIVLPDPFWNSRHIFRIASPETQIHFLVKHTINVLKYRKLALTDFDNPIVAFAPFRSSVDPQEAEFIKRIAEVDGLKHAEKLFGRKFSETAELWDYVEPMETPEQVVAALADPARLLFDIDWTDGLLDQIKRSLESEWTSTLGASPHAGQFIVGQSFGRMGQATDILFKSRYLSGVPLIDAPTSWKYFNWKLEYNSAVEPDNDINLHMVRGLQRAGSTDEEWLGNIPVEAIIEMRTVGAFEEIRSVLSTGIKEIAETNPSNFFRSSDRIVENIRDAFERHQKEIKALRARKIRFAGHDLGSMLTAGAIDIASIVTGTPTFGAASFAVNQLVDAPKLREIPARFRELKNASAELRKSPMGIFFEHKPKR